MVGDILGPSGHPMAELDSRGPSGPIDAESASDVRLRESLALLRTAGRVARVGGWSADLRTNTTTWSDEMFDILEWPTRRQPALDEAMRIYPDECRASILDALERAARDGTPFDLQVEVITGAARRRWVRATGEAERDASGAVVRLIGAFQDVTELRTVADEAMRLSEQLSATLEGLTDGFCLVDRAWRYRYVNASAEQIIGLPREKLLGRSLWEVFPQTDALGLRGPLEQAMRDRATVDVEFETPTTPARWLELRVHPSGDDLALSFRDITARKEAELALQASEQRLRLLSTTTSDAVWEWTFATDRLSWNEGIETLFGFDRERIDPTITFWSDGLHPEDHDRVTTGLARALEAGDDAWSDEYRFRRADGTFAHVLDRARILRDATGRVTGMLGGLTDQTERHESQARIAEQAAVLDQANDAIVVLDLDKRVTFWNRGAERLYGWTADEMVGHVWDARPVDNEESTRRAAEAALRAEHTWTGELRQRTKAGTLVSVLSRWTVMLDAHRAPRAVLLIATDITERKALERQFLRAQRLESIGTLAGGMAHDLNNVLTPILLSLDVLAQLVTDDVGHELLGTIKSSAQRGADLVRQVLSFARGVESVHGPLELRALFDDVSKLVLDTFPKTIATTVEVADDVWRVQGDRTQLHQVLMNLCVNARDAMPGGGQLTVTAGNRFVEEVPVDAAAGARPGRYVEIRVADTGTGMTTDVLEKLFEPFFTTKETGRGTGLGLSTSLAIVRSHGGFLSVRSEAGRGSVFTVCLPADLDTGASTTAAWTATPAPAGRGELVLLVDDEPQVRSVAKRALEHNGYEVVTAAHGAEAVVLYAEHRRRRPIVVTDMTMPVMDGPATVLALRALDPDVRVIGSSGLGATGNAVKAADIGLVHFVTKPYEADQLLRVLREVAGD